MASFHTSSSGLFTTTHKFERPIVVQQPSSSFYLESNKPYPIIPSTNIARHTTSGVAASSSQTLAASSTTMMPPTLQKGPFESGLKCPSLTKVGLEWPATSVGEIASVECGPKATGFAYWTCSIEGMLESRGGAWIGIRGCFGMLFFVQHSMVLWRIWEKLQNVKTQALFFHPHVATPLMWDVATQSSKKLLHEKYAIISETAPSSSKTRWKKRKKEVTHLFTMSSRTAVLYFWLALWHY